MIGLVLVALLSCLDPERAERAYRDGDFGAAMALYEAALAEPGAAAGPLCYNLGNCALRLGRPAEAMLHYKRALLHLPGDPQVRFNLSLAEQRLGVGQEARQPLAAAVLAWLDAMPAVRLLLLVAALETAGLLACVLGRRGWRAVGVCLVLLAWLAAARLVRLQWLPGPPEGVVVAREVVLRDEPHDEAPAGLRLVAGESVRVAERTERWARVVHARGGGWTERSGVGVVE